MTDMMASGQPALKARSTRWRQESIVNESRKLFTASTVARAIDWRVSEKVVRRAEEEAIARWQQDKVYDRALLDDIDEYIDRLPLSTPRMEPLAATPNDHSVIGCSRKKGGQAKASKDMVMAELESEYNVCRDLFTLTASGSYAGAVGGGNTENIVRNLQTVTLQQRSVYQHGPEPAQVLKAARSKFARAEDGPLPRIEPAPLVELGGKVRIVTLHSVEEVMLARNITSCWLSQLRKVVTTRDMLRNRPVTLRTTEDGDIFSADLSAATDHIPHEVAQRVALRLYERIGAPCDKQDLLRMFGPHMLPNGTATSCGIHMGLGPTWVILSLLNGFAAWYAGAHKHDHRICGDDLVALWRERTKVIYTQTLEDLGMVVNHSKSFHGRCGVFCERYVVRTGAGEARAEDIGHLSQASAAKLVSGRTHERLAVAADLWASPHIQDLSKETAKSLTPCSGYSGPLFLGGNGRGKPARWQHEAAFRYGTVSLVRTPYRLPPGTTAELRAIEDQVGDVPVSDLLIIATTRLRLGDNFKGKKSRRAKSVSNREFLNQSRSRRLKIGGTKESLLDAIAASPLNSRDRKTARWLASRCYRPLSSAGGVKWMSRLTRRPRANRYVSIDQAKTWLESISQVPWELGRSQLTEGLPPGRSTGEP
jgi:hypothetical protein